MDKQNKECCGKYKYMQVGPASVVEDTGFGQKIVLMHTEEAKDTSVRFCPECGNELELYWTEKK